ncbi:DNA polymerase III subunit gamma/tau [Natronospirillum operosum]|uniref:DNA polymerase III subunit gamma/tau n=1 Tax=Natronospirillum operosum TaxID=2759953 RepID=A0A4Z0WJ69_9GAMM|nr:DNA polymerase III subunit gamma/tau [Natronospirillum operosum]TGG95543.1 DNA polymerase III subunit gamma/tau [Natronospirillum operosum]
MSYQVLARKWRPQQFTEMVGQRHVLKALVNALDQDRLHHAYLFTGTRGVGKTTLARLFAKSLNCEEGVSSTPCGVCSSCVEIAENRFVDLIEVDAASRTKVEDTRELLDNVQYAPTRGRFKVYLIDEVHMLSNHSFNALLKTLEEPPPHVKFLLATTDPQKLPVTVLSRCLQFNLKSMTPDMVVGHLQDILQREQIEFEAAALLHLGKAAQGSMRDALSLTDQAVAYGQGAVREAEVAEMLGTVDTRQVLALIEALCRQDARALLQAVERLAEFTPDWQAMMADVLALLHQLTIMQLAPDYRAPAHDESLRALAARFAPDDIQLYYQLGLQAHRDLEAAPEARQGFEMALLRMLAFAPEKPTGALTPAAGAASAATDGGAETGAAVERADEPAVPAPGAQANAATSADEAAPEAAPEPPAAASEQPAALVSAADPEPPAAMSEAHPAAVEQAPEPAEPAAEDTAMATAETTAPAVDDLPWGPDAEPEIQSAPVTTAPEPEPQAPELELASAQAEPPPVAEMLPLRFDVATQRALDRLADEPEALPDCWLDLIPALELSGVMENMVRHAVVTAFEDGLLRLHVDPEYQRLYEPHYRERLEAALQALGIEVLQVSIEFAEADTETFHQRAQRERREALAAARASLENDPLVMTLVQDLDGQLLPDTVEPVTDGSRTA